MIRLPVACLSILCILMSFCSVTMRVWINSRLFADAQNRGARRQRAARHHEAHRGASHVLAGKGDARVDCRACCAFTGVLTPVCETCAGAAAGSRRAAEEAGGAGEEGGRAGPPGERDADAERVGR